MTARSSGNTSRGRIPTSSRSCAATRSTAASPMPTARSSCIRPTPRWSRSTPRPAQGLVGQERRPGKGQSGTDAPFVFKDKVLVGISGGEFGVRGWVSAYNIKDGKLVWRGYSDGPDSDTLIDPDKTTGARQAGRHGFLDLHLARRPVEDRRRHHLGLVLLRSRAEPRLLRLRQSLDLEPGAAPRRQQVVDDDLGPRPRHRQGQVGLPDDPARRVGL